MRKELLRGDGGVGIDGTHMKIFAKERCRRCAAYVLHGGGHVVFVALKSASAIAIFEGFEAFRGMVERDAATMNLGAHSQKPGLLVALCNAHGRRKFFDTHGADTPRVRLRSVTPPSGSGGGVARSARWRLEAHLEGDR